MKKDYSIFVKIIYERDAMLFFSKLLCIIIVFLLSGFFLAATVSAQESGTAKVYISQFIDLHVKVEQILKNVKQIKDKNALREELLALQKLIYRLDEEASRSNLDILTRSHKSDKTCFWFLKVAQESTSYYGP